MDTAALNDTALAPRAVELTEEQQEARQRAARLLLGRALFDGSNQGRLLGPAGSGKTTITRGVLDDVEGRGFVVLPPGGYDEDEDEPVPRDPHIALLSPTNRAARRATQVTGRPFQTLHRFLYRPEETRTARGNELALLLAEIERAAVAASARGDQGALDEASAEAALVRLRLRHETRVQWTLNPDVEIVRSILADEGSMIGAQLWEDAPERPTIFVGDHHQLPPVNEYPAWKEPGWVTIGNLRTVHRHAGPIREFAEAVRAGRDPAGLYDMDTGGGGPLRVQPQPRIEDLDIGKALTNFDVILVGRHAARRKINLRARAHLFGIPLDEEGKMEIGALTPRVGDRVAIRSNAHGLGLLNGDTARVLAVRGEVSVGRSQLALALQPLDDAGQPLGRPLIGVECDTSALLQYALEPLQAKPVPPRPRGAVLIDFAFALTVHAMQGSEAPRVLVLGNTSVGQTPEEIASWRYTAASRAQRRLVYLAGSPELHGGRG